MHLCTELAAPLQVRTFYDWRLIPGPAIVVKHDAHGVTPAASPRIASARGASAAGAVAHAEPANDVEHGAASPAPTVGGEPHDSERFWDAASWMDGRSTCGERPTCFVDCLEPQERKASRRLRKLVVAGVTLTCGALLLGRRPRHK